jgi:amidohydrolase
MTTSDLVKSLCRTVYPKVLKFRQTIHQHPELSFKEKHTSAFISKVLTEYNISHKTKVGGGYGVVGIIKGNTDAKTTIALRADMDALPIQEKTGYKYSSKVKGVSHMCGHDVHTSCLLGAAIVLKGLADKGKLKGNVMLIFQPAEETVPGGAKTMITKGKIFSKIKPKYILAQHTGRALAVGKVAISSGEIYAADDSVKVEIKGSGGHLARAEGIPNPLEAAARILKKLEIPKHTNPDYVLNFGDVCSENGSANILANKVTLKGTIRAYSEDVKDQVRELLKDTVDSVAEITKTQIKLDVESGYPVTVNDKSLTKKVTENLQSLLGKTNVVAFGQSMTSEDFGYFAELFPSCYWSLGVGEENTNTHMNKYLPRDESLLVGMQALVYNTLKLM